MFDAKVELEALKSEAAACKKSRFRKSRLLKFQYELLELRKEGASYGLLQRWLRKQRIVVAKSTIIRFLKKYDAVRPSEA